MGKGLHGVDLGEWEFGETGVVVGTFRVKSIRETGNGGEVMLVPRSGDFVGAISWGVSAEMLPRIRLGMHLSFHAAGVLFRDEE